MSGLSDDEREREWTRDSAGWNRHNRDYRTLFPYKPGVVALPVKVFECMAISSVIGGDNYKWRASMSLPTGVEIEQVGRTPQEATDRLMDLFISRAVDEFCRG